MACGIAGKVQSTRNAASNTGRWLTCAEALGTQITFNHKPILWVDNGNVSGAGCAAIAAACAALGINMHHAIVCHGHGIILTSLEAEWIFAMHAGKKLQGQIDFAV